MRGTLRTWLQIAFAVIVLLPIISCGPRATFRNHQAYTPERIAILPAINQTVDVKGGIVFRNLLYYEMVENHYSHPAELTLVDSLLNAQGITDGGQLSLLQNEELFDMLQVDGLFYIHLLECEYTTLGISETRWVKVELVLYTPPSKMIWKLDREIDLGKSVFDTIIDFIDDPKDALEETVGDLATQVGEKTARMWLLEHELKPEMEIIISEIFQTLP